jgi:hypothetical protein
MGHRSSTIPFFASLDRYSNKLLNDDDGPAMLLALEPIWHDHDGMVQLRFSLEGAGFAATVDFYSYGEALEEFGRALHEFPRSSTDEVVFENGSSAANSYRWLVLRAFVFNSVGHSALEVECQRNGTRLVSARSRFAVELEPATLNRLGLGLATWASRVSELSFVFDSDES